MGMDCVPVRGTESVHYNWSGWRALGDFLDASGVDVYLAGSNDGERIPAATCRAIAVAIEQNADEYDAIFGGTGEPGYNPPRPSVLDAKAWRESGGMRQW